MHAGRSRPETVGAGRLIALLAAGAIVGCVGVVVFASSASAAACGDTVNLVLDPNCGQEGPPDPPPVTVTVPTTITETETQTETETETVDRTITETVEDTVLDPTTVTVPTTATVPTTVTVTDGSTALVPTTVVATRTLVEPADEASTTTERVTIPAQATDVQTSTVDVTWWSAPTTNPQTGQTPGVLLSAGTVVPGQTLTVTGSGYSPGEVVQVWLHSEPVLLGDATADSAGEFSAAVTIPVDTAAGQHTIEVVGVSCGVTTSVPITVVAAPPVGADSGAATINAVWAADDTRVLSYTGVDAAMATTVGLLLLLGGVVLIGAARRRPLAGRHRG